MTKHLLILSFLSFSISIFSQNCNFNENAEKHWYKAAGMIKEASEATDKDVYLKVFEEYKKALEYAPNCPDIYYNLGYCAKEFLCERDTLYCDSAIVYFKKYLKMDPKGDKAEDVKMAIYHFIGAKKEKFQQQQKKQLESFAGKWKNKSTDKDIMLIEVRGNRIFITIDTTENKDNDAKRKKTVEGYMSNGFLIFEINYAHHDYSKYDGKYKSISYYTRKYKLSIPKNGQINVSENSGDKKNYRIEMKRNQYGQYIPGTHVEYYVNTSSGFLSEFKLVKEEKKYYGVSY